MDAVAVWRIGVLDGLGVRSSIVEYVEARRATFGAGYGTTRPPPLTPVRAAPPLADGPLTNAEEFEGGKAVALALRGGVNFVEKARAVQAAGAAALIVLNTEVENFVPNAPDDDDGADVTIPVVCVSAAFADQLLAMADTAKADIAAIDRTIERVGDDELRDTIDGEDEVAGFVDQIEGVFSAGGERSLGLMFSATNLRRAIESGDEGKARAALAGGRWRGEPAPAGGGFDPLRWEADLPATRAGAGNAAAAAAGTEGVGGGAIYTSRGSPPLLVASWLGHEPIVRLLLAAAPRMAAEAVDPAGEGLADISQPSPLAELHPHPSGRGYQTTALQDAWAEAQTDADGWTPLIAACWRGHLAVVQLLLRGNSAAISLGARAKTAAGGTAMSAACDGGHWPIVELLLHCSRDGLELARCGDDGRSGLHLACWRGHTELVKQLLMAPGHEESSEKPGSKSHRQLLDMQVYGVSMGIMVGGMLLDDQDREGNTPLALAAREGHTEVVKLLLWAWKDGGGDLVPSRQNEEGGTPLGQAAFRGHLGVVQAMVEAGVAAGLNGGDKFGFRPVQLAAQNGHTEVVRWLEEQGCTWPPPEPEGAGEEEGGEGGGAVERQVERQLLARARGELEDEEGGATVEEIVEGDDDDGDEEGGAEAAAAEARQERAARQAQSLGGGRGVSGESLD